MLAALASASIPDIVVAGVRSSEQANDTDASAGIDQAVVQDSAGRLYDVYACDGEEGRTRLAGRVRASRTLRDAKDPNGLGFALDHVLAFVDGEDDKDTTDGTTVMIAAHNVGVARQLDLLTLDDCAAMGTAIGAVHRLRPNFLQAAKYPVFTTGQIRAQLTAWIKRLRQAGHVPSEITSSWSRIMETEGLWSFATCLVHGGFADGDVLFSGATITAMTNWQNMQVNDPARDLAWIFGKLDESHRNAVLAAYGRMMGSRLDDLIMLRANLWLQMEQVGDFISALSRADSQKIMQFKAQVERLAHQLSAFTAKTSTSGQGRAGANGTKSPSTITVGTLLDEGDRRREAAERRRQADEIADPGDRTDETDRTGSADIQAAGEIDPNTMAVSYGSGFVTARSGSWDEAAGAARTVTRDRHQPVGSQSATITLGQLDEATVAPALDDELSDETDDHEPIAHADGGVGADTDGNRATGRAHSTQDGVATAAVSKSNTGAYGKASTRAGYDTPTISIPLLEREERAMRDAQSGLSDKDR